MGLGLLALLFLSAGCDTIEPPRLDANTLLEIEQLRADNRELRGEVRELEGQVETLRQLGDKRLDLLYKVQRIKLGSVTGGVNLDGKCGDDGVKAAIAPVDQHGSVLKVAGAVKVQVFDLAEREGARLVAECERDANTAAAAWYGGVFGGYYGLSCPWRSGPPAHDELTVRAEFTEYLTGKTFTAQKVVKVDLPAPPKEPETQPATKPNE